MLTGIMFSCVDFLMLQIELWKRIIIYGLVLAGLLFALPNAFYSRVESYNDANSAIENGQDPDLFRDEQQLWFDYLPSSLVNLGLDLRGGAHLLAEVRTTDVHAQRIKSLWPDVRDVLRQKRSDIGTIRLQDSTPGVLRVKISKPEKGIKVHLLSQNDIFKLILIVLFSQKIVIQYEVSSQGKNDDSRATFRTHAQ